MAFNPTQFKQKKKRAVNPDAAPRPNLMAHDKVIREQRATIDELDLRIRKQADEIDTMKNRYRDLQASINQILNYLRKGR
jgi:small-conductance mechanosensitive channel